MIGRIAFFRDKKEADKIEDVSERISFWLEKKGYYEQKELHLVLKSDSFFIKEYFVRVDIEIKYLKAKKELKKNETSKRKRNEINQKLKLSDSIFDYDYVMNELVSNEFCADKTFKWIFVKKGKKYFIAGLFFCLYHKGYFKRIFDDREQSQIALNSFGIKISDRTFRGDKIREYSVSFNFIKPYIAPTQPA